MEVARLRDALNTSFKERGCLQVNLEMARAELGALQKKAPAAPAQPHQHAPGSVCVLCGKPRNESAAPGPQIAQRLVLELRVVPENKS